MCIRRVRIAWRMLICRPVLECAAGAGIGRESDEERAQQESVAFDFVAAVVTAPAGDLHRARREPVVTRSEQARAPGHGDLVVTPR
jgi:hypothetical protein